MNDCHLPDDILCKLEHGMELDPEGTPRSRRILAVPTLWPVLLTFFLQREKTTLEATVLPPQTNIFHPSFEKSGQHDYCWDTPLPDHPPEILHGIVSGAYSRRKRVRVLVNRRIVVYTTPCAPIYILCRW